MMLSDLIYSHSDPCVDIYYSAHYNQVLLGARRLTHSNRLIRDHLTKSFVAWPSNNELGAIVFAELEASGQGLTPSIQDADSNHVSISAAQSAKEFESAFWYFAVWTKPDVTVPLIVGTPLATYYPDSFNRRPIDRAASASQVGAEVRKFILEVSAELRKAGLPYWT